jgi:hypothetical protein
MSEEEKSEGQQTDEGPYAGLSREDLIGELERVKKAQSGSDKAYQEERKKRVEAEKKYDEQLGDASGELKKMVGDLRYREAMVQAREAALEDAVSRGLPQSLGVRLADVDPENTRKSLDEIERIIDEKAQEKSDARFEVGTKPKSAPSPQPFSFDDIGRMSEEELKGIPADVINRAIERGASR